MKVLLKVIRWIVTSFLFVVLAIVVFQKFTHNKVALGNIYIFQIVSESMLPEYRIGDIIVVKKTNVENLKVGDDITYLGTSKSFDGLTITHRIVDMREEDGKRYFTTKGMSNFIEDPEISGDNIYGKVIYHTVLFSFVGRLMTNIVIYYLLFISIGVSFSYEFITSFLIKKDDKDDEEEIEVKNDEENKDDDKQKDENDTDDVNVDGEEKEENSEDNENKEVVEDDSESDGEVVSLNSLMARENEVEVDLEEVESESGDIIEGGDKLEDGREK